MKFRPSATALLAAALAPFAVATADPGDDFATAGGIDDITEAALGPTGRGGVRPDNMPKPAETDKTSLDRFAFTVGADWTNAYIWRGFVQEDSGFIIQPYATISYETFKNEDVTLNFNFSTWQSFHDNETASPKPSGIYAQWYEADYTVGASVVWGKWNAGVTYGWLTSPSAAFTRIEELTGVVSFDDSEYLGAWSLKPAVLIAYETGPGFNDGRDRGVYLQLGILPGFDVRLSEQTTLRFDFPVSAGFSLHNYYQNASGGDAFFGFVQAGTKLSVPLPLPESFGAWTFNAAASICYMGDHPAVTNGGTNTQWVFSSGVSLAF